MSTKLKMESLDDNNDCDPYCKKICEKPEKKCKQGLLLINVLDSISNKYDISADHLVQSLTSYSNLEELNKYIMKCIKKDNKKEIKKQEKFIPMEDGKELKMPKIHNYFHSTLKISDEDKEKRDYFHNGRFNKRTYFNKKWNTFKNSKKYNKFVKDFEKKKKEFAEKVESLKKESGFMNKPKKPGMVNGWMYFLNKTRKEIAEDFKGQPFGTITKHIGSLWNKLSDDEKEDCKEKDKIRYTKQSSKYVIELQKWEEYCKKNRITEKEKSGIESDNDDANGSDNDDANGSDNDDANGSDNDDANESDNNSGNESDNGSGNESDNGSGNESDNNSGNESDNGSGNESDNNSGSEIELEQINNLNKPEPVVKNKTQNKKKKSKK